MSHQIIFPGDGRCRFDQVAVQFFVTLQFFQALFIFFPQLVLLGDIMKHQHHAKYLTAISFADRRGRICNLVLTAIPGNQCCVITKVNGFAGRQYFLHRVFDNLTGTGIDDRENLFYR